MGVVVTFDPTTWKALWSPTFDYLSDDQATQYFNLATAIHRNDGGGPVVVAAQQTNLLNLITAHMVALFAPKANGAAASPLVGRISDATEGSVSVSVQNEYPPGTAQWFQQTQYGSMYWVASAPFRTMRYIPNPRSPVNAGAGLWGPGVSGGSGYVG